MKWAYHSGGLGEWIVSPNVYHLAYFVYLADYGKEKTNGASTLPNKYGIDGQNKSYSQKG